MSRALLLAFAILLLAARAVCAEPRNISHVERAAITHVADFLDSGPETLYEALSADSPLRLLRREDALGEIKARTGPPEGSRWSLQVVDPAGEDGRKKVAFRVVFPSGFEDGVLLDLKFAGRGRWKIHGLTTLAEPVAEPAAGRSEAPPFSRTELQVVRAALLIAAAGILVVGWRLRLWRRRLSIAVMGAACALFGVTLLSFAIPLPGMPASSATGFEFRATPDLPFVEMRRLEDVRRAVALGRGVRIPLGASEDAREIAALWRTASGEDPAANASAIVCDGRPSPMRDLLCIYATRGMRNDPALPFDLAVGRTPRRDDVIIAAAIAAQDEGRSLVALRDLIDLGTREAAAYYLLSMLMGGKGDHMRDAADVFRRGWALEPLPHRQLLRSPRLKAIADRAAASGTELRPAKEELDIPAGTRGSIYGRRLLLRIRSSTLEVPNGARLAPLGATILSRDEWEDAGESERMRNAERILARGKAALSPFLITRRLVAVETFAERRKWDAVLRLTDDFDERTTDLSAALLLYRLTALLRTDRHEEALALTSPDNIRTIIDDKPPPALLVGLGDAAVGTAGFDAAEQLYRAVDSRDLDGIVNDRLFRLRARREIAHASQTLATRHFDMRYPAGLDPVAVEALGSIVETEYARIEKKLPPSAFRRIVINVIDGKDFRERITRSDFILGLYDGEILIPIRPAQKVTPDFVSVIAHEITHALVAQATSDNAPRWFQEAIAQRHEYMLRMNPSSDTPLPRIDLLDTIMTYSADPATVATCYTTAETFLRFLETSYGGETPVRLVDEFARGMTTEEALLAVTGRAARALDSEFQAWRREPNHFSPDPGEWEHGTDRPLAEPQQAPPQPQQIDIWFSRPRSP